MSIMNGGSSQYRNSAVRTSFESSTLKTSTAKKRKTNGFKGVIRKIFRRRAVKSQISLPTPSRQLDHDSSAFITSVADNQNPYQRAVSLPAPEISRASALGSHAPSPFPPFEDLGKLTSEPQESKPPRPRRATLPSVIINTLDRETLQAALGREQTEGDTGNDNENYIGFAITSGSNPKRRSKSADALYDVAKAHRMSPIQWRRWRRRSDEIKHWRDSTEAPAGDSIVEASQAIPYDEQEHSSVINENTHGTDDVENSDDRNTFDFGLLATTIHNQEQVPVEERIVTLEVKLMDLEYAISKLQKNTVSPVEQNSQRYHPSLKLWKPNQDCSNSQVQQPSPDSSADTRTFDDSTIADSQSTQPTSQSSSDYPFIDTNFRPVSTATTVRPQTAMQMPTSRIRRNSSGRSSRHSLTSLTIEHYTTLISLLRREQSARMRLEDQVTDLQQQISDFKSSHQRYQPRHHQKNREFLAFRTTSDVDETDTDDGFQDVYETPSEQKEFERLPFGGTFHEGEAF